MNPILKCGVLGGAARVTVLELTELVNEEIKIHSLSPLACAALGRSLVMGAYIGANLKSPEDKFSVTINGGGPLGNIVISGKGNTIRGYIGNPAVELPLKADGHLDVGGGVGRDGYMTVVKDLGLKEPYVGRCELATGEIAEDFVKYLSVSEGVFGAAAFGVKVNKDGCVAAGGLVAEPLPGIDEEALSALEGLMSGLTHVSDLIAENGAEGIFEKLLKPFGGELYAKEEVVLKCLCSRERIESTIKSLGKKECDEILAERGEIEVVCDFCEKRYVFGKEDMEKLWEE